MKYKWLYQIDMIHEVLENKGFNLVEKTDADDRVEFEEGHKAVFVNSRCHPETRFYTMLHELGHILVSEDQQTFSREHPMYVHSEDIPHDGRRERSKAYKVSLVSEEIAAWKLGRRFAKTLGLYVDDKKYDKHMPENIMSHIEWAAE